MAFSDSAFIAVFPFLVFAYYLLPWSRLQGGLLLVASALFLASFGLEHALFAGALVAVAAAVAAVLNRYYRRRWPLAALLLAILVLIKTPFSPVPHPIGVSYYIFVLLSIIWSLPVLPGVWLTLRTVFFAPHLVAGPISLGRSFIYQLDGRKRPRFVNLFAGTQLFVLGFLKKVLIADPIALSIAPVWHTPSQSTAGALVIAAFGFYIQLYADFSGYTDMARGLARLLGYRLPVNFRGPYLSATPIEFWRRWHVSLSTWIRLYLFMPLSMQVWRRVRSKSAIGPATLGIAVVVMVAVALWHEISLRFLIFGTFHGTLIGIWYMLLRGRAGPSPRLWFVSWLLFQSLLGLSLIVFRAESLGGAIEIFSRLFTFANDGLSLRVAVPGLLVAAVIVFGLQWLEYNAPKRTFARWLQFREAGPVFPLAIACLAVALFFKGMTLEGVWVNPADPFFNSGAVKFIYAQF